MTDTPDLRTKLGTCDYAKTLHAQNAWGKNTPCKNWRPEPSLPELLEGTKDHVMIGEEIAQSQCRACYRIEPSAFCSAEPNCMFRKQVEAGAQPDTTDLQENIDSNDRLAEGLVRGVQEMGASQVKLPVHIDGETWDVSVRLRGAEPEPDEFQQDWARYDKGNAGGWEKVAFTSGWGAGFKRGQARAGSSPAPSPVQPDGYAYRYPDGIRYGTGGLQINGSDPIEVIPLYFHKKWDAVTGNEGKDERDSRGNTDRLHVGSGSGDSVSGMGTAGGNVAPLASPAVVTPEQQFEKWWCDIGRHRFLSIGRRGAKDIWQTALELDYRDETIKALSESHDNWVAKVSELKAQLQHYNALRKSDPYEYRVGPCCGDAHMLLESSLEHIKLLGFETETVEEEHCTVTTWHNRRAEKAEAELERMRAGGKS